MARVRRGRSPTGSPALSATPTGEGVRKVCVEVGYAGDERKVRWGWGALALDAPRNWGSPEKSGHPALGAPWSPNARLPTQFSERALRRDCRPRRAPRLSAAPGCPSPREGTPARTRPLPATAAGGAPALAAAAAAAAAGRRARRAVLGQSCREAGERSRGRRLAPSPTRSLSTARSGCCSLARSPPPLAPRAHNEAAGREVVPAAASAPLPQPMPPPAEHLALGWKGGPGGRGLGAGARPPGGGVRTRVESAFLCGPPELPDLPLGETPLPPRSSRGSAPPTRTPAPHTSGLGLPPPAPGALRPPARPPGWSPAFPSISLPAKELPAPLPQGGPPPLHAPLGARADGRPDRRGMNSSKSYRAKAWLLVHLWVPRGHLSSL